LGEPDFRSRGTRRYEERLVRKEKSAETSSARILDQSPPPLNSQRGGLLENAGFPIGKETQFGIIEMNKTVQGGGKTSIKNIEKGRKKEYKMSLWKWGSVDRFKAEKGRINPIPPTVERARDQRLPATEKHA